MMKRLITIHACALAAAAMLAGAHRAHAAEPGTLDLTFQLGAPQGAVMVALFDSEEGYRKNAPVQATRVGAETVPVKVAFRGLKPGRYAVKAFHDLNDDGALNVNAFDMPTEPFAFSNNAPPRFGPPAWSAAAFEVGPDGAAQTLVMR